MLYAFEPDVPAESAGKSNTCALYLYCVFDNVWVLFSQEINQNSLSHCDIII